jgi:hypothetical protein
MHPVDGKIESAQTRQDGVTHQVVVFGKQDSHGGWQIFPTGKTVMITQG